MMDDDLPEEVRALEWNDLPVEVIDWIVTQCSGPTVLRLRLVSKTLKAIVDTNKRFKKVVGEVCVKLNSETLPTFIMEVQDIPFQRLFIDTGEFNEPPTPNPWFVDSELLNRFIQRFSRTIRKLRVTRMFCGTVDNELKFYESLVNLRVLEVDELEATEGRPQILPVAGPVGHAMKVLKVTEEMDTGDYFVNWIKRCPSLEEIALPDESASETATIGREAYGGATLKRNHCYPYILRLGAEGHLLNLRILHFSEPIDLSMCSEQDKRFFYDLTQRKGFRIRSVSANMLEEVRLTCVSPEWKWGTLDAFKRTVESLEGMHEMLQEGGFETLERLTCDPFYNVLSVEVGPLRLPGLRKLELWIEDLDVAVDQRCLDRLCLPEEPRWSVEHLELFFNNFGEGRTLNLGYLDQGFPNLRSVSLKLHGCSREQKAEVIEVMRRKPFLEEMTLDTVIGTPEDAFFGGVEESPVLLLFPKLKKLSLHSCHRPRREVEVMTDRSLQLFGRIGLSHLSITGRGWESVTNEGVRRLLEGMLGRTVVSVELTALEVKGDEERKKLLDDVKEVARRNKEFQ